MRPRTRTLLAALGLGLVSSLSAPAQQTPPVIELHRTANASFIELTKRSPIFVLVIGSDVREGDPKRGRADSLHLVAINPNSGRGTIVGIPRDSYVPIPGLGASKINASLSSGGPERTVQTVSQLAGVPIHYWALVEFTHFRQLVDAVGGVKVDVPYPMHDASSGANFEQGATKMDGGQALAFSRARKTIPGGDFGRSANQGRLLLAAIAKFRTDSVSPIKLATYLSEFHSLVESNVPVRELLKLAAIARRVDPAQVENVVLPGGGGSAGGSSIVVLSPGATQIFAQIRDDAVR